jgi:hypothetical protein
MQTRPVGHRVRGLVAGATVALLTPAFLIAPSTAAGADPAFTETDVEREMPVTILVDHPCTGEPVVLQGHLLVKEHITSTATHVTVIESTNTQVTGVNPITGVRYVSSDADTFTLTVQKSASGTGHQSWLFSRSGESWPVPDDFYLHILLHFSTNAAGVATAEIENFSTDCR